MPIRAAEKSYRQAVLEKIERIENDDQDADFRYPAIWN
jgi:hypothetical protein